MDQKSDKSVKLLAQLVSHKPKLLLTGLLMAVLAAVALVLILNKDDTPPAQVEQQLSQSLQTSLGRSDGLDIKFDSKTGLATITQTEQTEYPEISAQNVRIAYTLLVKMGQEMFQVDGVKSLKVIEKIQVNPPEDPANKFLPPDQQAVRPPETTEVATIAITKTNFNSVKWAQYKKQPIDKLITEKAYEYTINPELKLQLKDDELYLDLR